MLKRAKEQFVNGLKKKRRRVYNYKCCPPFFFCIIMVNKYTYFKNTKSPFNWGIHMRVCRDFLFYFICKMLFCC